MARYVFSAGKITIEEGVYTPFKKLESQQTSRGVLLLARPILKSDERAECRDKEHSDGKE